MTSNGTWPWVWLCVRRPLFAVASTSDARSSTHGSACPARQHHRRGSALAEARDPDGVEGGEETVRARQAGQAPCCTSPNSTYVTAETVRSGAHWPQGASLGGPLCVGRPCESHPKKARCVTAAPPASRSGGPGAAAGGRLPLLCCHTGCCAGQGRSLSRTLRRAAGGCAVLS